MNAFFIAVGLFSSNNEGGIVLVLARWQTEVETTDVPQGSVYGTAVLDPLGVKTAYGSVDSGMVHLVMICLAH